MACTGSQPSRLGLGLGFGLGFGFGFGFGFGLPNPNPNPKPNPNPNPNPNRDAMQAAERAGRDELGEARTEHVERLRATHAELRREGQGYG